MKKWFMLIIVLTFFLGACTTPPVKSTPTTAPSATTQPSAIPTMTPLPTFTPEPTTPPEAFVVQADGTLDQWNEEKGVYELVPPDPAKVYEVDGVFYSFDKDTNELLTITPPPEAGLTARIQLDPVENIEYLYAFDEAGQALYRWDVKNINTDTVESRWRKLNLTPYSEFHKPTYQAEYTYRSEDGKLEIPLHIGLSALPVTKVFFKEPMVKLMGEQWLTACWYRYTEHMGNDVTFDEYLELVKQGKGQVEMVYRDERTGADKKGMIDPREGVSVMLTGKHDLPLKVKADSRYPTNYQITVNAEGLPIIVFEYNLGMLAGQIDSDVKNNNMPAKLAYAFQLEGSFISKINYWATLSWQELIRGGQLFGGVELKLTELYIEKANRQMELADIDLKTATETPFISVEIETDEDE